MAPATPQEPIIVEGNLPSEPKEKRYQFPGTVRAWRGKHTPHVGAKQMRKRQRDS